MNIDTLSYLEGRNDIRLKLSDEKRKLLLDKISEKYGNVTIFCKRCGMNYDTAGRWLTLSVYRRREPSFVISEKFCNMLDIKNSALTDGTLVVGSGHSFQKVPKTIRADENFWEGFGLYYGDGQNKIGTNEFVFTSITPELSIFAIKWFRKYFGANISDIRVYVYVPQSKNRQTEANAMVKAIKIPVSCLKASYHQKKLSNTCILTMVRNSALRYLFDEISKDAERLITTDKRMAAAFLRGYLAAEGNVYMQKNNRVCCVTIGFGKRSEFEMIGRQLTHLGIEFTTSHGANKDRTKFYPKIDIHKKDSVIRLYETVGFGPNKKRHKRLESAVKILRGEQNA